MFQTFVGIDEYACSPINVTRPRGCTAGPASSVVQCSEPPVVVVAAEVVARSEKTRFAPHLIFALAVSLAPVAVAHAAAGEIPFRSLWVEDQELELGVYVVLAVIGDREHSADVREAVVLELPILETEAESDVDAAGTVVDDALVEAVTHHPSVWQSDHQWLVCGSRPAHQFERQRCRHRHTPHHALEIERAPWRSRCVVLVEPVLDFVRHETSPFVGVTDNVLNIIS